ncbi:hypothetical protein F2Q68_00020633 [Brassica cretica]|uniref:Uncharacterized protein n=1 Tax=Brassica cretica TaxID=69181 RepID=A0A8S9G1U9_BRACR|nr:hypothetical protein F2Q68_00020633 [Brassica cretica]
MAAYQEHMLSKRLDAMQSMVERLPGVAPPIRKSNPQSYVDTPLTDEITLIEMPRKFSFPSIKAYDGTSDPDDHVANTDQELLDVKWKENVANRAKAQLKQDSKAVRPDRTLSKTSRGFREQKPGKIPEPRGQQDKWPQKIKAPDSFQNPGLWCVFHCDHGQKMEDSIALRIEVTKLLRKGPSDQRHIGRFENLRHKPRIHEEKHLERQTRPRGSQTEMPAPGHGLNILHSEEARKGFSGEVKQTAGEVILPVYAEGMNMSTKFLVVDCESSYNMILGRPWFHGMGAVPSTLHQIVKFHRD